MIHWKIGWRISILFIVFVLFFSFLLSFLVEFLAQGDFKDAWIWFKTSHAAWFASYLAILGFFLLFSALLGRSHLAFGLLSILLIVPSTISGIKWKTEGTPLFPWDVILGIRNLHISPDYFDYFSYEVIIGTVMFIGIFFLISSRWFRIRLNVWARAASLVSALILIAIPYSDKPYPIKKHFNLSTIPWDQEEGYMKNGFLLSSIMNYDLVHIKKPQQYSAEAIHTILDSIKPTSSKESAKVKPNIIVILSEAFWDPTVMKDIKFSEDPIPTFHRLAQQYPSGWMLSPQFGGGTANVEFEVLTGNSMRFLPDGSIPYVNYIHQGVDSLASILSRDGYTSTAINPLDSWFFHSKNAYQDFGFGRFISSEFFPDHKEGLFLSDQEVANQIIDAANQSSGPDFVFANTMENHYPFYPGKFKENKIKVTGNISEASKGELETYAQGVSNADKMLKQLVDYFSRKNEPTIVVFFGDHMPALSDSVYHEANYFLDNDANLLEKKYRVPVLVWNNYLPEQKDSIYISPSYLGPYVLHQANVSGSDYTDFLYSLSKRIPVIPPVSSFEKMNISPSELENYKLLEYDALFGNQYAYSKLSQPIVNPNFVLGPQEIFVNHANQKDENGKEEELEVDGENFSPNSVLFLANKPLKTKVEDTNHLSAQVPIEDLKNQDHVNLQVRILDSRHIVLAKSNELKWK